MIKKHKKISVVLALLLSCLLFEKTYSQIYAPDGLRMPGDWNEWFNEANMGGDFELQRITHGTLRWHTSFQFSGTTGNQDFKFVSSSYGDPWGNQWAGNTNIVLNSIQAFLYGTPSDPDNSVSLTQDMWYTVVFEDNGYEDSRAVFMETSSEPITVASVSQNPAIVSSEDQVVVTASLSDNPSTEEFIYLRYTTDNWLSTTLVTMDVSANIAEASIPAFASGTEVEYYIFSSVFSDITEDFDLLSLMWNNNNGDNYSYVVDQTIDCGIGSDLIYTVPAFPLEDESVEIYFNAELGNGGLFNYEGNVYAHTGVITSLSDDLADWRHVVTEWGENSPETLLERIDDNLYKLIINNVRQYYDVPVDEEILQMAFVFRSEVETPEGYYLEHKTASNSDILIDVYEQELDVKIVSPSKREPLVSQNQIVAVCIEALENDSISLFLNDDLLLSQETTSITYPLIVQDIAPGTHWIIAKANAGTSEVYDSTAIYLRGPVVEEPLPEAMVNGINYIDDNTVTLVLHDPPGLKEFVFAIGDFSDWLPNDDNYMKWDTETNRWWVTINDLIPQEEYAFQYFIDNDLKLACPYAEKILDPWNDKWIPETTYPDLKEYPWDKTIGNVSVFQKSQEQYEWQMPDFVSPVINENQSNLVIYELLIRDFTETSDIKNVTEKLDYLESLGVTAIQLMPIMEFDGNDSWGYAPNFFFATDKYYGKKNDYKNFIDECHKRGISVILDIVLNHAFGQNPMALMYFDEDAGEWGQPSPENPWFNQQATHPYSVGYDFNHESPYTRQFSKDVMTYWMEEFKIDGFRFDLSKGITQNYSGEDIAEWNNYDQSRIDIWLDYKAHMKSVNPDIIMILEHFANNDEEIVLANEGFIMWGDMNEQFNQNTMGYESNHDFSWAYYVNRGFTYPNLIPYMESHDEERLMYRNLEYGAEGTNTLDAALNRMGAAASMYMTIPGPKMIWQFGELGYDYSIFLCPDGTYDDDCRTSAKPVKWDYLNEADRQKLFVIYSSLIKLKTNNVAFIQGAFSQDLSGLGKRMWLSHDDLNVAVSANFATSGINMQAGFQHAGTWYNYFTGESFEVTDPSGHTIFYEPGDYYVFVDQDQGRPFFNVNITVISDEDELPIENAEVNLSEMGQRMTNVDGEASLLALYGEYEMIVSKYGWETYSVSVIVDQDIDIVVRMMEADVPELYAVTFNVDMTPAIEDERFDPENDYVDMAGNFLDNWEGTSGPMEYIGENIYSYTTEELFEVDSVLNFKFRINGDWETAEFPDGGDDREYIVIDGENIYNGIYDTPEDDDNTNILIHHADDFLMLYPNPTTGILNIAVDNSSQVFVYSLKGNLLFSNSFKEKQFSIDMTNYNNGVYIIKIIAGNNFYIGKVIKY